MYAGAVTVTESLRKPESKSKPSDLLTKKTQIAQLRWQIGWLSDEVRRRKSGTRATKRHATKRQHKNLDLLKSIYIYIYCDTSLANLQSQLETLKGKLRVTTMQVWHSKARSKRKEVYDRYKSEGPSCLDPDKRGHECRGQPPTSDEVTQFWESVIGVPGEYNLEDPSIVQWKESISISSEEGPAVDQLMFKSAIKRSRSWKADGHNGICAYW